MEPGSGISFQMPWVTAPPRSTRNQPPGGSCSTSSNPVAHPPTLLKRRHSSIASSRTRNGPVATCTAASVAPVLLSMMCTAARTSLWSNLATRSVARCAFTTCRTDGWWFGFTMAAHRGWWMDCGWMVLGMVNCCGGPSWPTSGQQVVRIRDGSLG